MKWKPYPRYKDAGVEWVGKVPEHWVIAALGYRYEVALGKMLDEKRITGNHLAPYLRNADVQWDRINTIDLPEMDFSLNDRCRYRLAPGDLLVCEGGEVGRAAIWREELGECYYQKALHRLRPYRDGADHPRFMLYVLYAAASQERFTASESKSTIAHLTAEALRRYRFAFPPCFEQFAIAAFLDRETAKLDVLIAGQERLIELLHEKRQALLSHTVTKGLNTGESMKDSGVDWLGRVPVHWDVVRLGALLRETAEPGSDARPVLRVSIHDGVSDRELDDEELDRKVVRSEDRSKYKRVEPGDLVYNMMRAWQGGFGAVTVSGMVSPAYVVARPLVPLVTEFVEQQLRTPQAIEKLRRHSHGVTDFRLRLYWDEFKSIKVALPPLAEQREILRAVERESKCFEELGAKCSRNIDLMREHRAALISAAVTGKIDVRECELAVV